MNEPMNPPLRCVAGDMAVWESHHMLDGIDYYGTIVVCDRLVSSEEFMNCSLPPIPAWHTKSAMFSRGSMIVWQDQFLRPIRPAADPRATENKRILEKQIDRQTATGVIAC